MNERRGMTVLVHSELAGTRSRLLLTGLLAILRVSASLHISHWSFSCSPRLYFSALFLSSLLTVIPVCDSLHTYIWLSISRSSGFCFPLYF